METNNKILELTIKAKGEDKKLFMDWEEFQKMEAFYKGIELPLQPFSFKLTKDEKDS